MNMGKDMIGLETNQSGTNFSLSEDYLKLTDGSVRDIGREVARN